MRINELFNHKPKVVKDTSSGLDKDFSYSDKDFVVNGNRYRTSIKIYGGMQRILVSFSHMAGDDNWTIDQQNNQSSPSKVFGAVANQVLPYVRKFKNYEIVFRSEVSGSRERLYDVMVKHFADKLGRTFSIERLEDDRTRYTIHGKKKPH